MAENKAVVKSLVPVLLISTAVVVAVAWIGRIKTSPPEEVDISQEILS